MFDGLEPKRDAGAPAVWLAAAVAVAPLAVLSIMFADRPIATWSHEVLAQPALARRLTALGQAPLLLGATVLGALVLGFFPRTARIGRALGTAAIALVLALLLTIGLKFAFGRTWPETWVENNPSFIKDQVYGFFFFHGGYGYQSFPSGHTARLVAPCAVLGLRLPQLRPLAYALPALMMAGLIAANFHFLGDCLGGIVVGLLAAYAAQSAAPRLRLG